MPFSPEASAVDVDFLDEVCFVTGLDFSEAADVEGEDDVEEDFLATLALGEASSSSQNFFRRRSLFPSSIGGCLSFNNGSLLLGGAFAAAAPTASLLPLTFSSRAFTRTEERLDEDDVEDACGCWLFLALFWCCFRRIQPHQANSGVACNSCCYYPNGFCYRIFLQGQEY